MRQAVGLLVELAIAQALLLIDQCQLLGIGLHLPGNQFSDARRWRQWPWAGIPVMQQALPFACVEHDQFAQRRR
ncbi:hypothetical protein D3C84_971520 [compost metagenome]